MPDPINVKASQSKLGFSLLYKSDYYNSNAPLSTKINHPQGLLTHGTLSPSFAMGWEVLDLHGDFSSPYHLLASAGTPPPASREATGILVLH